MPETELDRFIVRGVAFIGNGFSRLVAEPHLTFCFIWLGTAAIFFVQAAFAFPQMFEELPAYNTASMPAGVAIGGVDIGSTVDGLVSSYNGNVKSLSNSIQETGALTFILNMVSGFFALLGFFMERRLLKNNRSNHEGQGYDDGKNGRELGEMNEVRVEHNRPQTAKAS